MSVVQQNKWYVEPVPGEETEGWLLTYLDLITLLLVLLVVMLALSGKGSSTNEPTSAGLMPAHTGLLPGNPATDSLPPTPTPTPTPESEPEPAQPADDATSAAPDASVADPNSPSMGVPDDATVLPPLPDYLHDDPDAAALSYHLMGVAPREADADPEPSPPIEPGMDMMPLPELGDDIEIIRKRESISFRINSEILYSSAKADLSLEGLDVLRKLIPVLKNSGYSITVEGHTDAVPVRRGQYPSNWELSGARAGRVVRYLAANGVPRDKLRAIGYADTKPLATNESDQGRSRNRRVEIILEKQTPSSR